MKQEQIFSGLKVVELAGVLAGPAVGMFFAELGASVVKIENKRTGGDVTRKWKLPSESKEDPASAYYHAVNWNKEVLLADLTVADHRAMVFDRISSADLLLVNFKPGDEEKLGLVAGDLLLRYPRLIIGRITGFGVDDTRPAFDAVLQAETGFMSMNGVPEGPSLKMPVALIDVLAAHQLKEALLLALLQRERTGRGCIADVNLYQSAVVSLMNQSSAWLNAGVVAEKMGSLHPNIAPYGETFRCADGRELLLAVGTDQQFEKLLRVVGCEQLIGDVRFGSNTARVANREALAVLLEARFSERASPEWLEQLSAHKVPAAPVNRIDEVFNDPENSTLVLEQREPDGRLSRRCKTIAFTLHGTTVADRV